MLFVLAVVVCVMGAFWFGRESDDLAIVTRLRRRARYLRWLSMGCLAVMGAMVVSGVETVRVGGQGEKIASIAMAGIVAIVLASVYRYIVRLAYFFDGRADAFQLLGRVEKKSRTVGVLARLTHILAPERVSYEGIGAALKALAPVVGPSESAPKGEGGAPTTEVADTVLLAIAPPKRKNAEGGRQNGSS
jgi:branched-subunit amino acid transport protein